MGAAMQQIGMVMGHGLKGSGAAIIKSVCGHMVVSRSCTRSAMNDTLAKSCWTSGWVATCLSEFSPKQREPSKEHRFSLASAQKALRRNVSYLVLDVYAFATVRVT
jgi:hypothetical protein